MDGLSGVGVGGLDVLAGARGFDAAGAAERGAREGGAFAERFERAREAAQELVAGAFVKPVLSQLRDSTMAAEPFKPGTWERRFGPVVDQAVANELVKGDGWNLVDVMAERFVGMARTSDHGAARVAIRAQG